MIDTIINRMRRKIDIVRLDAKARQDVMYHDMNELLSLLDMLERELDAELAEADDFIAAQAKDHNSNNIRLAELAHSVRVLQAKLSSAVSTIAELTALKEK